MSHLSLETIARIVDEGASAEEKAHLDSCRICTGELEGMREDVQSLHMMPDISPAPEAWGALERRLTDEGLIRARPRFALSSFTPLMQMAAAVVLFVGGSIAGRMTAPVVTQYVADGSSERRESAQPAASNTVQTPVESPAVTLTSNMRGNGQPRSADEAAEMLREMEELYLNALTRYAELTSVPQTNDPVARLAALQSIVNTTQAALNAAPADPVINGYHLTALAQRDATLRQVAAATGERWY
jgi:poly-gamma-glutamate capsule biosynthesis protein CapA/YwtB (metallophosphatase superfamily)